MTPEVRAKKKISAGLYYQKNKQTILAKNKQWFIDNPDKKNELARNWRKNNPVKVKSYYKTADDKPRRRIKQALRNAKQRCINPNNKQYKAYGAKGIEYRLDDKEELAIEMLLPGYIYLISLGLKPSLDRKNSKGHYDLDNIRALDHNFNVSHCDCCILRSLL